MNKKKITLSLGVLALCFSCSSCTFSSPYTAPVYQGKEITNKQVSELKPDMTKAQVRNLLGYPDIIDTFNQNQYIYVNTYKPQVLSQFVQELKLVLTFKDDKLVSILGNYAPPIDKPIY